MLLALLLSVRAPPSLAPLWSCCFERVEGHASRARLPARDFLSPLLLPYARSSRIPCPPSRLSLSIFVSASLSVASYHRLYRRRRRRRRRRHSPRSSVRILRQHHARPSARHHPHCRHGRISRAEAAVPAVPAATPSPAETPQADFPLCLHDRPLGLALFTLGPLVLGSPAAIRRRLRRQLEPDAAGGQQQQQQ